MNHVFKASIAALACTASLGFALAGTAAPAPAAEPQRRHLDRPGGKGDMVGMLTAVLDLSADQQAQVKVIVDDTHSRMKAMSEDTSLSKDDMSAKTQELHENAMAKVNGILTPEQQEKFAQFQKDHPLDHMAHHGPGGMHDLLGELTTALNLTPDQQVLVKSLFADVHPQMEAIEADTTLSQEDKKTKLKDLHDTIHDKIRGILTPDQQKTFDQLHKP